MTARKKPRHPGFETRDVKGRTVAWGIGILFVALAVSVAAIGGLLAHWDASGLPVLPSGFGLTPATPLEVSGGDDRRAVEEKALAQLQGYGWSDQAAGTAHIPIDRAMEITAKRGWPDKPRSDAR
jgi:hypothetical protein